MSASLLSSFLVFVLTGLVVIFFDSPSNPGWLSNIPDRNIRILVCVSIFWNAVYFYYFAALVELNADTKKRLKAAPISEWWIRSSQQTAILLVWTTLYLPAYIFGAHLISMYLSFLLWNFVTRSAMRTDAAKSLWITDGAGLVVSVFLIFFVANVLRPDLAADGTPLPLNPIVYVEFGMIIFLYFIIAVLAICNAWFKLRFNPFDPKYYSRQELH